MHNKTIKTGTSLEITMLNLIKLHGAENCRVATVTLRNRQTMYIVGRKLTVLLKLLKPHFQSIIAVCSLLEDSAHVHLLLVMKTPSDSVAKLNKIFKLSKSKAKFGFLYDFKPIHSTPEQVAGYFKKNYYEFMESRLANKRNVRGKAIRMVNVPLDLKIDFDTFSSWNPDLINFRRGLTRFAEIYGTEVGDEYNLSRRMRLPMREIRQVSFALVNTLAGKPQRWPLAAIRDAVANKRREYCARLEKYQSEETNPDEGPGSADDFFVHSQRMAA